MLASLLAFIVFVGVLIFVVQPVVEKSKYFCRINEDTTLQNLEQEKFNIYAQIKEADFEYEMGKLSHRDYSLQREELLERASEVIDHIDQYVNNSNDHAEIAETASEKKSKADSACPSCGATLPNGAKFCYACGTALASVCEECGSTNPANSKFCANCGRGLVIA